MKDEPRTRKHADELRAVIDRLEDNGWAVLVAGDDETAIDFPRALLPADCAAGDHLRISITLDREARAAAEDRTRSLLEQLESHTTPPGTKDFKL